MEMQDKAEELNTEPDESIPLTENTETSNSEGEWSNLPRLPLEKIYTFLSREDQVNMSLVCRNWSEEFGSPAVWHTFRFIVRDSMVSMETCPEIKFAQRYSHMFRHVEIVCRHLEPESAEGWQNHLKVFLEILRSNSQLLSVKFRRLGHYFIHLDPEIYNEMLGAITHLLESQHHLERVEFHECYFRFQKGVELLKCVIENCSSSLTHLVLRGFAQDDRINMGPNITASQTLPPLVDRKFPRLTTFETDYSKIFDSLFAGQSTDTLENCQIRALTKIILHCEGIRCPRLQGFTSSTWRLLKQLCPHLKVDLYFLPGIRPQQETEFFILPEMPISLLDYRLDSVHEVSLEMGGLLSHLTRCAVNNHLVSLHLVWMFPIEDLATAFVPFLQACPNLKCLQLFTIHPVNGIDLLLRSWVEFPLPALKEVVITISNVRNRDDYTSLVTLADDFVPVLQVSGLNVLMVIDDIREQRARIERVL